MEFFRLVLSLWSPSRVWWTTDSIRAVVHFFFKLLQYSNIPIFLNKIIWQAVMYHRTIFILFLATILFSTLPVSAQSESDTDDNPAPAAGNIALVKAVMCEDIQDQIPQNPTTVFSIERRKAICFTAFDPVPQQTVIYHHWFHHDRPSAKIKLTLKPPRWSTYSTIQFREEDIGPWRVEITDAQGQIIQVLRFSITE
jgi:hypothetical protein